MERGLLLADDDAARGECRHCGRPIAECSDASREFYAQRLVCRASMERAAAERAFDKLHEDAPFHDGSFASWAKEWSEEYPYHAKDGMTVYVADTDVNPGDLFTADADAVPVQWKA